MNIQQIPIIFPSFLKFLIKLNFLISISPLSLLKRSNRMRSCCEFHKTIVILLSHRIDEYDREYILFFLLLNWLYIICSYIYDVRRTESGWFFFFFHLFHFNDKAFTGERKWESLKWMKYVKGEQSWNNETAAVAR